MNYRVEFTPEVLGQATFRWRWRARRHAKRISAEYNCWACVFDLRLGGLVEQYGAGKLIWRLP